MHYQSKIWHGEAIYHRGSNSTSKSNAHCDLKMPKIIDDKPMDEQRGPYTYFFNILSKDQTSLFQFQSHEHICLASLKVSNRDLTCPTYQQVWKLNSKAF